MGFTDDCYTDGRDLSVTPSVLFLPTDCIAVTDGISPSAKLYNVVVNDCAIVFGPLIFLGCFARWRENLWSWIFVSWPFFVS
jgi:hypothetical protein